MARKSRHARVTSVPNLRYHKDIRVWKRLLVRLTR